MRRLTADGWAALVLLAVCGVLLRDLLGTSGSGAHVKTTTLPVALAIALAILSLLLLASAMLRSARAAPSGGGRAAGASDSGAAARVVAMLVGTALYIAALPWAGYFASTALLVGGLSLLYGNRRPLSIGAAMVIVPAVLLLFFERYMLVLLPTARLLE